MSVRKISAGIKARARYALAGHLGTCVGALILYALIGLILLELPVNIFGGDGIVPFILYEAAEWLILSFMGIFRYGLYGISILLQYGKRPVWQDVFAGFRESTNKILTIETILCGIEVLCLLPAAAVLNFYNGPHSLLIGVLLYIGGALGVIFTELTWGLSLFVLLDYPDIGATEALKRSAQLMKGNRGVLFYIYISYLPLFLLGILSFGIGDLFVAAYFLSAQAAFYRSLVVLRSGKQPAGRKAETAGSV